MRMGEPMSDALRPVPIETLLTHRAWVDALARRLVADDSAADDVAQQTWLAAMRHPPGDEATARSWLGRVVRNFARERHREEGRRTRREAASARPESSGGDVAAVVARAELHKKLVLAVMDLEEPYRATILLRFFEGLPPRDVATRMSVPVETVRTRTRRAVEQLRARLDREHDGDRRAWAIWVPPAATGDGGMAKGTRAVRVAAAAAAAGGVLMAKKVIVAALVLVLVALGTWVATRPGGETKSARTPPHGATAPVAAAPRVEARTHPEVAPPQPAPTVVDVPALTGRVVDAGGRGVAGATVVAAPVLPPDAQQPAKLASAACDADGRFRVEVGDGAPSWTLFADAPGGAHGRSAPRRPGDDVVVSVTAGATLTGHVTDPDGHAVEGALVRWISTYDATRLVRRATTGKDGAFRLEGVPSGARSSGSLTASDTVVCVDADGFAPLTVVQPADLGTPLDLRLSRGAIVVGRATDAESGAPVAGVRVLLWNFQHPQAADAGFSAAGARSALAGETKSDADGRYRFEHVACTGVHNEPMAPGGRKGPLIGRIGAFADGYAPADDEVPVPKDGETVETALKLWASTSIEGRVVDAAGRPMPGFRVTEWAQDRLHAWLPVVPNAAAAARGFTDAEGRYRLDGVPVPRATPGTTTLYVHPIDNSVSMGFNGPHADVEVRAGETTHAPDLVIGAEQPASAWVDVVDEDDHPVWGAKARLDMRDEATSGRDGRLQFWFTYNRAGIPPHAVTLRISAPGRMIVATPEFVPSATDPPTVRVRLPRGRSLSGRVIRTDGTPVGGAWVNAIDGAVPPEKAYDAGMPVDFRGPPPPGLPRVVFVGYATTAADGTFVLDGLPPGAVHLGAAPPDGPGASLNDVAPDAHDVVLTVRVPGEPDRGDAEVTVVDEATNEPLRGATALLFRPSGSVQGVDAADAPGVVRFASVVGGTWDVRASHAGHVTKDARFTIERNAPAKVRVALAKAATVRGRVIVPAGLTLDAAVVALQQMDRSTQLIVRPYTKPASDGTFEIADLPAGRWTLTVYRGPGSNPLLWAETAVEVETRAGEVTTADVRAVRAYQAAFVLGEPRTYTSVGDVPSLGTFSIRDSEGRTVATGDLRVLPGMAMWMNLPEGRFTLTVKYDGADPVERTMDVTSGKNEPVQVPLPERK